MFRIALAALAAAVTVIGCSSPEGKTKAEKQEFVVKMHDDVMKLAKEKDKEIAKKLESCVGHAAFSNTSVTFLFAGGGGGYGLAEHHKSGTRTFMRLTTGNVGIGIGAKEYRLLMLFKTEAAYQTFLQGGWKFGADAEAAAKDENKGGAADASATMGKEIEVYQLTDAGAIAAATLTGGKFARDSELN